MENSKELSAPQSGERQLVTFKLGDEEFGVDISNVQEINKVMSVTKYPKAPEFVAGIINLRGRVIPVIDLRKRLGMESRGHDKDTRIIVAEFDNSWTGFIVDAVNEVLRIPADVVEPLPQDASRVDSEFIESVGKLPDRLLILIRLERLLRVENSLPQDATPSFN